MDATVFFYTRGYYSDKKEYYYDVIINTGDKHNILLCYSLTYDEKILRESLKYKNEVEILKPIYFEIIDKNRHKHSYGIIGDEEKLDYSPEDLGLYIPKPYDIECEIKKEVQLLNDVPKSILNPTAQSYFSKPFVIFGEKYDKIDYEYKSSYYKVYCPHCGTSFEAKDAGDVMGFTCQKCHTKTNYNNFFKKKTRKNESKRQYAIVSKNMMQHRKEQFRKLKYNYQNEEDLFNEASDEDKSFIYYVSNTEGCEGFRLSKIVCTSYIKDDTYYEIYNVESYMEHIIGQKPAAYRVLKSGKSLIDPFKVINVNSKTIQNMGNIIYEDSENIYQFIINNESTLKKTGFFAALKYSPKSVDLPSFFLVFMGLVNKYPVIEQIIKMGHARLFFNLYKSMLEAESKEMILTSIQSMEEIVNPESRGGKDILRFPLYIGEYLIQKNASYQEYFYWRDLYELTHMTKEQFYNFTESSSYAIINSSSGIKDIGNILKFGYDINKLIHYIIKTATKNRTSTNTVIDLLSDYLNMSDVIGVEPNLFPMDLQKQHDDLAESFQRKEKVAFDNILYTIASECENYVIPDEDEMDNIGIPKLFQSLVVKFPQNEIDFIDEGNQQHNCVGSYAKKVKNGHCVAFFIRKKESPEKSFITAECTGSGLGQCYYSNNRTVSDENLMKFAKYIANKIKKGVSTGKIHALHKIKKY